MANEKNPLQNFDMIPPDELRRRLEAFRGPMQKKSIAQCIAEGASTILRMGDIAAAAGMRRHHLSAFMTKHEKLGRRRNQRLSRALRLAEAGYITKHGYRRITIHDHPVAQPVQTMRVGLSDGGVTITNVPQDEVPRQMPSFLDVFKGK